MLNVMGILDTFRKMYVLMIQKFLTGFQRTLTRYNVRAWRGKASRLFKLDLPLICFFFLLVSPINGKLTVHLLYVLKELF